MFDLQTSSIRGDLSIDHRLVYQAPGVPLGEPEQIVWPKNVMIQTDQRVESGKIPPMWPTPLSKCICNNRSLARLTSSEGC